MNERKNLIETAVDASIEYMNYMGEDRAIIRKQKFWQEIDKQDPEIQKLDPEEIFYYARLKTLCDKKHVNKIMLDNLEKSVDRM